MDGREDGWGRRARRIGSRVGEYGDLVVMNVELINWWRTEIRDQRTEKIKFASVRGNE